MGATEFLDITLPPTLLNDGRDRSKLVLVKSQREFKLPAIQLLKQPV
jgi:hypothetical protein